MTRSIAWILVTTFAVSFAHVLCVFNSGILSRDLFPEFSGFVGFNWMTGDLGVSSRGVVGIYAKGSA